MGTTLQLKSIFFSLLISVVAAHRGRKPYPRPPCEELVFYFHDILYNGHNYNNATSAIIGSPQWGNKTTVATPYSFGDLVVFDDSITLDNNLHSPPVGRAQGMYFYDQKSTYIYGAWLGFSFLFNSTDYVGTLNFAGADPLMNKTRDISVIGGTGYFFMARGIATFSTDSFEGDVYFRLRVDMVDSSLSSQLYMINYSCFMAK